MIDQLFGSLFGAAALIQTEQARISAAQYEAAAEAARTPRITLPPGIFWERTGGKTHRVVIRRQPEQVADYGSVALLTNLCN